MDADVTSHKEARLVGNSPLRKAIWISLFFASQAFRPSKLKDTPLLTPWIITNILLLIASNITMFYFGGVGPVLYLMFSTLFALGLHPLGGRWIQEHYVRREG
jgi:sphingolipid delta-4 desaturase